MINRMPDACCEIVHKLFERSLQGVVVVDSRNAVRYVNPAAEKIFCCPAEALLGTTSQFTLANGSVHEMNITTGDGRTAIIETWGVETEWNREPAWVVSLQDVTERKRTEQELRKMYRAVEGSPVMVVITDAQGIIEYINPKFSEITGYEPADVLGRSLCEHKYSLSSSDLPRQVWETVAGGKEWRGEVASLRKCGEGYYESVSIAPIEDNKGTITNYVAIIEDVTERRQYEEQLRSSERQLSEAQKIAHLGSWKRYLDTGRSFWSDELYRIFGVEPGSVIPSHEQFLAMVHPEDREQVRTMASHLLQRDGTFSSYRCRIVRPDGTTRVLLGQGEVVLDSGGTPTMVIGTALDVTEQKLMEEEIVKLNSALESRAAELLATNRELESFSYTVCHDLRSPLTNINGYCQVLMELCRDQLDEKAMGYLREISRGAERMNDLIETLLNFSLITRVTLDPVPVDLSELAREIVTDLQFEHPERQVEVTITPGIVVTGDKRLLRVVMQNLLGNAWKYTATSDRATIEFNCTDTGGTQTCYVRDNGIGFEAADADKLFAPFQRLPQAGEIQGHGIGLATVQRIIERHGGRVWAEGTPGKGATFFFSI